MPLEEADLKQISQLIADNNKAFTEGALKETLSNMSQQLTDSFTQQLNGAMARNKKNFENINTAISTLEEKYNKAPEPTPPGQDPPSDEPPQNSEVQKLMEQLANQSKLISELNTSVTSEKEARLAAEARSQKEQTYNKFINAVADKVVDPNTFLKTCLDQNKITEKDGALVVDTGKINANGEAIYQPATEAVDAILGNGLGYFAKARGGNGGGTGPKGESPTPPKSTYFANIDKEAGTLSATELYNAMQSGKTEEVMNELAQVTQN